MYPEPPPAPSHSQISRRCSQWISNEYGLTSGFKMALENPFDQQKNPEGCINLGTAENELMSNEMMKKIKSCEFLNTLQPQDFKYNDSLGILTFRETISSFLNSHLNLISVSQKVLADQVCVFNGCGSAVESVAHVLCDAGDSMMIPTPYYGGFDMDLERRAQVVILPVETTRQQNYQITLNSLNRALLHAKSPVKALLAVNPVNPLGIVYSDASLNVMIEFCHHHGIHLIMDEIYAFSVFDASPSSVEQHQHSMQHSPSPPPFRSILSVPVKDKNLVHFLWGFSKDFGLNGMRVGVLVSRNQVVLDGVREVGYFTGVSTMVQRFLTLILADSPWCERFLNENRRRLKHSYESITNYVDAFNRQRGKHLVPYLAATAGFFLWVDFSYFLGAKSVPAVTQSELASRERALWVLLIKEGSVYIAPGFVFHSSEPGWFRIIFAAHADVLHSGMERIFRVLQQVEPKWTRNQGKL